MRKQNDDIVEKLKLAQLHMVEKALIGFIEEREGKVMPDKDILAHGRWANFAPTPLSVFEKDTWKFSQYYIWRNKFVIALGFPDPEDLLCLKFVELRKEEWPTALRLFIAQGGGKEGG